MIRASKIIPIVDDNRQFQGISVTVYDNKIRKRIRLETYKGEVRYNLQDIAVMCGLQEIDSVSDYVVAGYDFWIKSTTLLRKKTPYRKLISKDTVVKFLTENRYKNLIEFIEKAESAYYLYLEWYLNPQKKRESLEAYKKKHRQEQRRYFKQRKIKLRKRLIAYNWYLEHKEQKRLYFQENKERIKIQQQQYFQENKEKFRERRRLYKAKKPDLIKAIDKKFRENHKEKIKANQKKYREAHKEELKEYARQYRESHREELKEKNRLYRLKKKQEKEFIKSA